MDIIIIEQSLSRVKIFMQGLQETKTETWFDLRIRWLQILDTFHFSMWPIVTHGIWRLGKVKCPKFLYTSVFPRSHKFKWIYLDKWSEKWWGYKMVQSLRKLLQKFLKNLIIELQSDPEVALLDIYSKGEKEETQIEVCTAMFIKALFTIAKR